MASGVGCSALLNEAATRQKKISNQCITPIVAQFRALFEKEYTMNKTETNRFNKLYQRHLRLLRLQGKSQKTIDAYSRAVFLGTSYITPVKKKDDADK